MSWSLRLGDCLGSGGLLELGDKSVDTTITDPPYGRIVLEQARSLKGKREWTTGAPRRHQFDYEPLDDETRAGVAQEIARVTRRWALVFCEEEATSDWRNDLEACGMLYVRCGAWVRLNGAPQITGDRPAVGFEAIVICHAAGVPLRWNGGGHPAVWSHPIVHPSSKERIHTTPKPLPLMHDLVRAFTDPGDLIVDPFAGSATTGVACVQLGRNFIGWELDETFHRRAMQRMRGTREQLELLAAAQRRRPRAKQARLFPCVKATPPEAT